jgi:hypothetical protein
MAKVDYSWIEKATHQEIDELHRVFSLARMDYWDSLAEIKEEKKIMKQIGELCEELRVFEDDLLGIRDNKEHNYGNDDVQKLKAIHDAVIVVERKIVALRKDIEKVKAQEKADLKKSAIMESRVDFVADMMKKLRKMLRF